MNIKELAEKVGVSSDIEDNFIFSAEDLKRLVGLVVDERNAVLKQAMAALYNMVEDGDVTDKKQALLVISEIQKVLA